MDEFREKLLEGKRLLTEQEKKRIIRIYNNRNNKESKEILIIASVVMAVLLIILLSFCFSPGGLRNGIIFCLPLVLWMAAAVIYVQLTMKRMMELIDRNELYVIEAILLSCSRRWNSTFEIKKNGKKEMYSRRVSLNDQVHPGEKVILVDIKGVVLVYKAV